MSEQVSRKTPDRARVTETPQLLDLKNAAERLGVHYCTARDFVLSGKLQGVRLGGRRKIQVREEDLLAFIEASALGPNDGPKPTQKPPRITVSRTTSKLPKPAAGTWRSAFRAK